MEKFNSKYYCPGKSHVKVLTANWIDEENWLCQLVSCIGSIIRHRKLSKAKGVLLLPVWPSTYFWLLGHPNGKIFAKFIKNFTSTEPFY